MYLTETKQCSKCEQYLELSRFYSHIRNNKYYYRNSCRTCKAKSDYIKRKGTLTNCVNKLFDGSKRRASIKNLEHNLTREWILANIPKICPVLGIQLSFEDNRDNSPSLDRFDNDKGYTKDNVKIISFRANTLKSNATIEELEAIVRYMKNELSD